MNIEARVESWPYTTPLRITGHEFTHANVLYVEIERNGKRGRSEAGGVYYLDDPPEHGLREIERVRGELLDGASRDELARLLPPGGAQNALDCALWDLEAKERGLAVWELAGLPPPQRVRTTYTLGADSAENMARQARAFSDARALKLKLTGTAADAGCVRAVRLARDDVWLAVDANQGFSRARFEEMLPVLLETGVQLVEQPFPLDRNAEMQGLRSPIPVAADESAQTAEDLLPLAGLFDFVNIKLDKCGGLTAALQMVARARELGLKVMVGNMGGTSLAMAPAFVLAQLCDIVDLDGPLLLSRDRLPSVEYSDGTIFCGTDVWGGPV